MPKRHREEVILARWTVEAAEVQAFAQRVRARYGDSPFRPRDLLQVCDTPPPSGLEVVCRDDAVFVGPWSLAFAYNVVSGLRLEDEWLLFVMEWGAYDIPVPVASRGRAEAARVAHEYTRQWAEEDRAYLQRRQAPTWHNRLLDIAEAHFAWVVLGFFFVALPLALLILGLVRGSLR